MCINSEDVARFRGAVCFWRAIGVYRDGMKVVSFLKQTVAKIYKTQRSSNISDSSWIVACSWGEELTKGVLVVFHAARFIVLPPPPRRILFKSVSH